MEVQKAAFLGHEEAEILVRLQLRNLADKFEGGLVGLLASLVGELVLEFRQPLLGDAKRFVEPANRSRRRHGIGRSAMQSLLSDIWPLTKRRTVAVLTHNTSGVAFWHAMGYQDYALTLEIMPSAPPHS